MLRKPSRAANASALMLVVVTIVVAALVGVAPAPASTIWGPTATPANAADPDAAAVELGVKFTAEVNGLITGIRFYKGVTNTGTHIGSLWSSSGTPLATATFTTETASGWQQVDFASPVAIAANTVYVASYHTDVGHYSFDSNYFAAAGVDNPPLHALRDGVSGGNGVYVYGPHAFPTNTYRANNYWVDVVFTTGPSGTPTATATLPSTATATPTQTPPPSSTPSATTTQTGTATASATFTATPPAGSTATATNTRTATGTVTSSATATATAGAPTATATPTPTATPPAGPCTDPANAIVAENCLPGSPPSQWEVSGAGDPSIQGFATDISVDRGQTISFKIDTDATNYRVDIYRLGYYGGLGARLVAAVLPSVPLPQNQPSCLSDPTSGLIDCGSWAVSTSWVVPANATSGIYVARPVRADTQGASHIPFVVRDDDGGSDLLVQTSDSRWHAYNTYGGNSLYFGSPAGRAYKVSYNRPITTRCCSFPNGSVEGYLFDAEYPMVRWLERNGYDVSYSSGVDTERGGAELLEHRVFMSVGQDEYWSGGQRANVEAARAAGVHLAFFSGNEVFWKTRWEPSIDASTTPYRTLVCYKETHANAKIDPLPSVWTGTWRDPRFGPHDGGRPENALTGTIFKVNGVSHDTLEVPAADGKMRFWRNTSIATLLPGQVAQLPTGTLGFEWDEDLDNDARPPGLIRLSTSTVAGAPALQDYGSTYSPGTVTHHLTLYRHASGALVFGAGTVQWAWGLDDHHDKHPEAPTDVRMQQATVNLFADMGVQPATLQTTVTAATASSDATAPTSSITSPTNGSVVTAGSAVTISGTAADAGGGVVGGVEVSVDGGTTWHPAAGRASWNYAWTVDGSGSATIHSRATDDSGNIETPSAGVTVTIASGPTPSPTVGAATSIWSPTDIPANAAAPDTSALELGVKFISDVNGLITGIRFYKGATNTGTHTGSLWSTAGVRLATATFTNETASGWQQVNFASPVAITANTVYVASYHTNVGHYSYNSNYFAAAGVDNPPLHALRNGVSGGNGIYIYGPSAFPTNTFGSNNYWVDVVFATVPPPTPRATATGSATATPTNSGTAPPAATSTATALTPVNTASSTLTATVTSTRTATRTPTQTATQASTGTQTSTATQTPTATGVPTATPAVGAVTIWGPAATPANAADPDTAAVELGVKFTADVNGLITGIRFYKGATNTGTHTGSLWSSTGAPLATATFTNETASGWQQVDFAPPVAIAAGTVYVASYHTAVGHYSYDSNYFAAAGVDNPPLHALRDGVSGGNGVYVYGTHAFPTNTYRSNNYWVDVVFLPAPAATPTATATLTASATATETIPPAPTSTNTPPVPSPPSTATGTATDPGTPTPTPTATPSTTPTPSPSPIP